MFVARRRVICSLLAVFGQSYVVYGVGSSYFLAILTISSMLFAVLWLYITVRETFYSGVWCPASFVCFFLMGICTFSLLLDMGHAQL